MTTPGKTKVFIAVIIISSGMEMISNCHIDSQTGDHR